MEFHVPRFDESFWSKGALPGWSLQCTIALSKLLCCRHGRGDSRVYTFSSPPTVITAPRVRVSPPRSAGTSQKPVPDCSLWSVDKNSCVRDDSGTECELDSSLTTPAALSVSAARLDNDTEKLCVAAAESRLSPVRQSVLRSSLREIPEDEIRRSGVSNFELLYMITYYS